MHTSSANKCFHLIEVIEINAIKLGHRIRYGGQKTRDRKFTRHFKGLHYYFLKSNSTFIFHYIQGQGCPHITLKKVSKRAFYLLLFLFFFGQKNHFTYFFLKFLSFFLKFDQSNPFFGIFIVEANCFILHSFIQNTYWSSIRREIIRSISPLSCSN